MGWLGRCRRLVLFCGWSGFLFLVLGRLLLFRLLLLLLGLLLLLLLGSGVARFAIGTMLLRCLGGLLGLV